MNRILIIDDDEDMLAMTERWLTKAGYEVSKATSGKAGFELLSTTKPDLILLDYAMPEMNGPEFLKNLRQNDEYKNIPVLYRTGMDDLNNSEDDSIYRPDGIVPKSEGKPYLLRSVGEVLS